MSKHNKGVILFSNYMDKGLWHFYVYGYYKIIINIWKNNNTLFIYVNNTLHISSFVFHTWQLDPRGTFSVKFGIYMRQTTIFKGGIK
jgi:hypothetical protein